MISERSLEGATGYMWDACDREIVTHALDLCREGLSRDPDAPDLLHLRGLHALHENDLDLALMFLAKAVAIEPLNVEYLTDYGDALRQRGRLLDALSMYLHVLARTSERADAYLRVGLTLNEIGLRRQAISVLEIANRLAPNVAQVHRALGKAFLGIDRIEQAIESFEHAAELDPHDAESWKGLGQAHLRRCDWQRARAVFERSLALHTDLADLHVGLAEAHIGLGEMDRAVAPLRMALALEPYQLNACRQLVFALELQGRRIESATAWCRLGECLVQQKRWREAEGAYRNALARKPDCARAFANLGHLASSLGKPEEAIPSYEAAIAIVPDHIGARHGLAHAATLTGDLGRARAEYVWQIHHGLSTRRYFEQPFWDGDSVLNEKTILVWSNGGLGDAIQWCRFLPLLKEQGARIVLEVPATLVPLLRHVPEIDYLRAHDAPIPDFDVQTTLGHLHWIFKEHGTLGERVPYLTVSCDHIRKWRDRLRPTTMPTIGLAWASGKRSSGKSIPPKMLAPLVANSGARFLSLQIGSEADALFAPPPGFSVECILEQTATAEDSAALILNLDLVIAADTMVVHLAGALGVPVWTMLRYVPDWRWDIQGETSPWYPSMRLFRQPRLDDWASVAREVHGALQSWRLAS